MKDLKLKFGKRLKEIRKAKGLTQEKLAELVNLAPRQLTRIETGENFPSEVTLAKFDDALQVDIICLFDFYNRIEVLKTGTDDVKYIKLTQHEDVYEVDASAIPKKSGTKYPKRINASDSETTALLWAKRHNTTINIEYPLAKDGEKFKSYHPDGRIENINPTDVKKKAELSEKIVKSVNDISDNEPALEFVKTAIDALTSKEATDKLKEIIKGIEAMRGL